MSNSKDLVPTVWGPEFLERLLPSSQQVSLLFHLSYLCLGKFPKLERILRMRCVETQMLFGSSEAVLVKCMGTSNNLVTSLFPMLIIAIEKDKPTMAVKYLEKARMWITDIVRDVDVIVKRYEALNKDVATTTSDVNTEKKETEAAQKKLALENQPLKDAVNELKEKLNSKTAEIENIKREMEAINTRLQDEVREMSSRSIFDVLYIFFIRLPFLGDAIKWLLGAPETSDELRKLQNEMSRLYELKRTERQKEWELQVQLIDMRMILFKKECDEDIIPKPTYLKNVQMYLSKIQKILKELKVFWEKVKEVLDSIQDKTFVNDHLIDDPELKGEFVKSIRMASEQWEKFGQSCNKAVKIFKTQTQDAYDFLEINVDSMSEEEWQREYDRVKKQLENIQLSGISTNKAITY